MIDNYGSSSSVKNLVGERVEADGEEVEESVDVGGGGRSDEYAGKSVEGGRWLHGQNQEGVVVV